MHLKKNGLSRTDEVHFCFPGFCILNFCLNSFLVLCCLSADPGFPKCTRHCRPTLKEEKAIPRTYLLLTCLAAILSTLTLHCKIILTALCRRIKTSCYLPPECVSLPPLSGCHFFHLGPETRDSLLYVSQEYEKAYRICSCQGLWFIHLKLT